MIAILIKTFNKNRSLLTTIASIEKFCRIPYRLYILDDGTQTAEKDACYAGLRAAGHFIEIPETRWAVTRARNYLVSKLRDEEFVLRIDDDFEFVEGTDIPRMIAIMKSDPNVGALSGIERQVGEGKGIRSHEISNGQGMFETTGEQLFKINVPVSRWRFNSTPHGRYAFCDHSRNFLLIRRDVLAVVKWDENIFFTSEHIDFMLSLKSNKFRLAFTPDSVHHHRDDLSREDKQAFGNGDADRQHHRKNSEAYLFKKWGFRKIVPYFPFRFRLIKWIMETVRVAPRINKKLFHA